MQETMKERELSVHNFFLIKHILDDKECKDELILIGTMIQHVFRGEKVTSLEHTDSGEESIDSLFPREEQPIKFDYRFNDETPDKRNLDLRRTEIHETNDLGKDYRHTFQVKVPLELQVEFDAFPFKVKSATLMIELSTFTSEDHKTRLRPNIMLHRTEKRNMIGIQKDPNKKSKKGAVFSEAALFQQAKDKMDKSYVYDFVSPFPNVTYLYDTKKRYCPKYSMRFMLIEDGMQKFMEIVFPIFLIAAMNHLNVLNAAKALTEESKEEVDAVDYLNNSATLALSVVVFLPTMIGTSRFHSVLQVNNMYIATIFIALTLSALPYHVVETMVPAQIGAWLFWASFLFPCVNALLFWRYLRKHKFPGPQLFMNDARGRTYPREQFTPSPDANVMDEFIGVEELLKLDDGQLAEMDFRKGEDRGKFKAIEFDTAPMQAGSG